MSNKDVFEGKGIRVRLNHPDDFLIVKESLERIGILISNKEGKKTLYQSCHILHKKGQYAIMHFFELFELDGRKSNCKPDDLHRRNLIARRLEEWGLLEIIVRDSVKDYLPQNSISIIPYEDKMNGSINFVQKYRIGKHNFKN